MAIQHNQAFASLDDLRAKHGELLREAKSPTADGASQLEADTRSSSRLADRVSGFLDRARATGRLLDSASEREAAQSILDYWTATLFTLPNGLAAECALPSSLTGEKTDAVVLQLENFDSTTLDRATQAADRWLDDHRAERALVRQIMLRVVRIAPDKPEFNAVPTVRAALYDLDSPERVNTVLDALAVAGVIRITKGETDEIDRISLRSRDLIGQWQTFADWCDERRRFRQTVEKWLQSGRSGEKLLTGEELDHVRNFHDRNASEREFARASAEEQVRSLRQAKFDRRAKFFWGVLAVVALCGWGSTIWYSGKFYDEKKLSDQRAAELAAQQQFNDLRRLVRTLANALTSHQDVEQYTLAIENWNKLVAEIAHEEPFRSAVNWDSLQEIVDDKDKSGLSQRDLEQISALQSKFSADPQLRRTIELARDQTFSLVEVSTRGIVDTLARGKPIGEARPFIREFWTQYWGEMLLFEKDQVRVAMIRFGDELKQVETEVDDPKTAFDSSVQNFASNYFKGDASAIAKKLSQWDASKYKELQQQTSGITEQAFNTFLKEIDKRTVPAEKIALLKTRQTELMDALAAERAQTQIK